VALFPEDRPVQVDEGDVVRIRLSQMELHRSRQWGACWLACQLYRELGLDHFWTQRLPARALQECNPSTGPSMDCSDASHPVRGNSWTGCSPFLGASANHGQSEKLVPLQPAGRHFPHGLPTNSATEAFRLCGMICG
jgi:hypothetical protein